jgi:NAD(P)-dependent dehydrogenase (short-subunit alcohol dehydrogenase family)
MQTMLTMTNDEHLNVADSRDQSMNQANRNSTIAVITGAAGGMGAPSAKRLAAQGYSLLLCDLDATRLEAVAAPLRAAGTQVEVLAADLSDTGFPARLLVALGDRSIGALIHTAGLSPTMADGPRIFEVNYNATKRLVDAVCPKMAEGSCAVLISSMSAYFIKSAEADAAIAKLIAGDSTLIEPMIKTPQGAYPLSKRAVIALVAQASTAFGARKARIASIAPGLIDTGMGRAEMEASPQTHVMLARTPLQRMGVGDEIASAAVFLCSPDASYITGCDIKVDGGTIAAMGL